MREFRRKRGLYVAELDAGERAAVAGVVADVAQLLGAGRLEDRADQDRVGRPDDGGRRPAALPEPFAGLRLRTGDIDAPDDDAVHRLLPDASRDDPQVTAEFRRLTEDDLRRVKSDRLAVLWHALADGPAHGWPPAAFVVHPDDGADLAATLTDLRLVLADRLGIDDDDAADALYGELRGEATGGSMADRDSSAQVRRYLGSIYAALSWLQESLLDLLLDDLDRGR
jgi:hypothetical protein